MWLIQCKICFDLDVCTTLLGNVWLWECYPQSKQLWMVNESDIEVNCLSIQGDGDALGVGERVVEYHSAVGHLVGEEYRLGKITPQELELEHFVPGPAYGHIARVRAAADPV